MWLLRIGFVLPGAKPEYSEARKIQKQGPDKIDDSFWCKNYFSFIMKTKSLRLCLMSWSLEIRSLVIRVFVVTRLWMSHLISLKSQFFSSAKLEIFFFTFSPFSSVGGHLTLSNVHNPGNWHVIKLVSGDYQHEGEKSDPPSFMPVPLHLILIIFTPEFWWKNACFPVFYYLINLKCYPE